MGICLGDSQADCFTNLRFADEVLLLSTLLEQVQRMMCDFKKSTERVGLKIHTGKTKLLSNQGSNKRREVSINNIKVEVLSVKECAKYLGQTITFEQRETTDIRSRIRAAWASFDKYKQELTSKSYLLQHRLRLFSVGITPTLSYASGTWTLSIEHERMIRSTQRKMLRLIVQTKRKHKKKTKNSKEEKEMKSDEGPMSKKNDVEYKESHKQSEEETEEGNSSNTDCDQDSEVSFMDDTDEENDTAGIEAEDWIEYIKRSTKEAEGKMKSANIPCWIEAQRKMKWRLAMRIASLPKKAARWNPALSVGTKGYRTVGRPKKRWGDEINHFLKPEETDETHKEQWYMDLGSTRPGTMEDEFTAASKVKTTGSL